MNAGLKSLPEKFTAGLRTLLRYRVFLFFLLLAAVYGFLVFRISVLNGAEPSSTDVSAQTQTTPPVPHIDQNVVKQLKSLQDNSVSVQTLFNDARNNPFQE